MQRGCYLEFSGGRGQPLKFKPRAPREDGGEVCDIRMLVYGVYGVASEVKSAAPGQEDAEQGPSAGFKRKRSPLGIILSFMSFL